MSPEDYDYTLPAEQIAQLPAQRRGDARMLVLGANAERSHRHASNLASELLRLSGVDGQAPLVVRNDSRVVPGRIWAERADGRRFELLICDPGPGVPNQIIRAWVRKAKKLMVGDELRTGSLALRFLGEDEVDSRARRFAVFEGDLLGALQLDGEIPLPPYIARPDGPTEDDRARYQTVYARVPGSVAAPTAGLHFESDFGLETAEITLHVGPGTFLPMEAADVRDHRVGSERISICEASASLIEHARAAGRPIIAVGTTSIRALESVAAQHDGRIVPWSGQTDLVITPGHRWAVVDGCLTNFHLPKSSLLMLICSLGGHERVMAAYADALAAGYRFYSYGDCMLLTRLGSETIR